MRCATILAICVFQTFPTLCLAAYTSIRGNAKLSAKNYTDWPGLVEAINDPSRVAQCWCNGDERFFYSGDTATLNRVLKKFAKTKVPELHVVLRPGPAPYEGKPSKIDWHIHVIGSIARASIQHRELASISDVHPTFTIFITDRLDLDAISMPPRVIVLQLEDIRKRYLDAQKEGKPHVKREATRRLGELDADANRRGKALREFKEQIANIEKYVERHRKASP
jgi:hypothetical protein